MALERWLEQRLEQRLLHMRCIRLELHSWCIRCRKELHKQEQRRIHRSHCRKELHKQELHCSRRKELHSLELHKKEHSTCWYGNVVHGTCSCSTLQR